MDLSGNWWLYFHEAGPEDGISMRCRFENGCILSGGKDVGEYLTPDRAISMTIPSFTGPDGRHLSDVSFAYDSGTPDMLWTIFRGETLVLERDAE
ncbi:MAG: hypothetical protein P0Y64_16925 [Candidatus Sphingomonas colombiensis]|nr:hypothetical protein [Sphingomonas sp.]WEK43003.1 MAG: hypothetical protein P0Y64_16925 [Sphingomonas sp.]